MNKQQAALLSIFSNSALIIMKVVAGLMMNSISVISEAIHSSLDLLASFIAFFSIKKAVTPEDQDHPFGHGKYENVSGLIEAILIFIAAALIIYEAAKKLINGSEILGVESGIIVMGISAVVNFVISRILYHIAKKTDSIALEADALHLMTDVYTSLGVFGGLIILRITGIKVLDPIAALAVAVLIILTSLDLTKRSINDLVDTSLPEEDIKKIIGIIEAHQEIMGYHKLRTRKIGNKKEIDMHLQIDSHTSVEEAHSLCYIIENDIRETFQQSHITLHIEPAKAKSEE